MVTVLFGWVASFFRTSIIGAGNEVRKHMEMLWDITKALFLWILDNLVFINIILSILIIFFQRRNPTAVWTWLLVLYFIPIVGFLLYLVVGQDYRKSRMFKMKEIEDEIKYAVRRQEESIYRRKLRLKTPEMERFQSLILYNLNTAEAVLTDNNDIRIFTDGREKFDALMEEMKRRKKIIFICNITLFETMSFGRKSRRYC